MARVRLKISASIHPDVLAEVDARGDNRSRVIERDLERYYELMRKMRSEMRLSLGKMQQAAVIDDWQNPGKPIKDAAVYGWWRDLGKCERCAVQDAAERYWAQVARGENPEKRLFEEEE